MVELGLELRAPNSNSDSSPGPSFSRSSQLRAGSSHSARVLLTPTLSHMWDGGGDKEKSGSVLKTSV